MTATFVADADDGVEWWISNDDDFREPEPTLLSDPDDFDDGFLSTVSPRRP